MSALDERERIVVCLNFGDSGQVVARQHVRGVKILASTHPDRTKLDADLLLRPNEGLIGRFPGETGISIAWAVLDRASRGWRGLTMTPAGLRQLQDLRRSLLHPPRQLRPQHTPDNASSTTETVSATA